MMRPTLSTLLVYVLERRRRIWLAVIGTSLVFGLFEFLVSRWLLGVRIAPNLHATFHAGIVGIGAGFAQWLLLLGIVERRRIIIDELQRVAELNHVVRNSLEVIVLAHHSERDSEHKAIVLDCTTRIDQTLKKLTPAPTRDPMASDMQRKFNV